MSDWLNRLLKPKQQRLDPARPIGAFKLCDSSEHVVEFWSRRCQECDRPHHAELPAVEAPAVPPAAPPSLKSLPPPATGIPRTVFVRVEGGKPNPAPPPKAPAPPPPAALSPPPAPDLKPKRTVVSRRHKPLMSGSTGTFRPPVRELHVPKPAWGRLHLTFELAEPLCTVGSDAGVEVRILGDQIAGRHATISLQGGRVAITPDSGAVQITNRAQEQDPASGSLALEDGDLLWVGSVKLRFERVR